MRVIHPCSKKYIMMNGLVHSPHEIINSDMLRMLINGDESSEENELFERTWRSK